MSGFSSGFSSGFLLGMVAHLCRVFRHVFWEQGAHLRRVLAGFWLGFRGFSAVSVAGKEEVAVVAIECSVILNALELQFPA